MARRVPLSSPHEAIRCLEEDGGVILTGFTDVQDVLKVNADAAPFIDKICRERAARSEAIGTVRCYRLFGRSETAREKWLQQPDLHTILRHFLRTVSVPYYDANSTEIGTDPILSVASTMEIAPGERAQRLHRDDFIWQQTHHRGGGGGGVGGVGGQETYKVGSDVSMGLIVPGVVTTMANGATAFVRGSHLWDHARHPTPAEVAYAEMTLGEAFLFLGSTAHGGGHNTTSDARTVHGFFYCRSYLRPEENQFLWWTREEIQRWSDAAKKQAGYMLDGPFLGHCDETHPLDRFRDREMPAAS